MKYFILLALALLMQGCSHRAGYDGIQSSKRYECFQLPPAQQDACLERASKPYEDYERERREVLTE